MHANHQRVPPLILKPTLGGKRLVTAPRESPSPGGRDVDRSISRPRCRFDISPNGPIKRGVGWGSTHHAQRVIFIKGAFIQSAPCSIQQGLVHGLHLDRKRLAPITLNFTGPEIQRLSFAGAHNVHAVGGCARETATSLGGGNR